MEVIFFSYLEDYYNKLKNYFNDREDNVNIVLYKKDNKIFNNEKIYVLSFKDKELTRNIKIICNSNKKEKNKEYEYKIVLIENKSNENILKKRIQEYENILFLFFYNFKDFIKLINFFYNYFKIQEKYKNFTLSVFSQLEFIMTGKITANIIHQLNNSLQVMLGYIEEIYESCKKTSLNKEISILKDEIYKFGDLLKRFKILNRHAKNFYDINILIESIIKLLEFYKKKRNIQIELKNNNKTIDFIEGEEKEIKSLLIGIFILLLENVQQNSKIKIFINSGNNNKIILTIVASYIEEIENNNLFKILDEYRINTNYSYKWRKNIDSKEIYFEFELKKIEDYF